MSTVKVRSNSLQPETQLEARARYFRVLGDPTRLRILETLLTGERTVTQLIEATGAPQSRVSNHLACLKWCRLVSSERRGRQVVYRIEDPRVGGLLKLSRGLPIEQRDHLDECRRIGPEWI